MMTNQMIIDHNKLMWKLLLNNHSVTSVILYDEFGWKECVGLNTSTHNTRLGYEAILFGNGLNDDTNITKLTKEEFESRYQIKFEPDLKPRAYVERHEDGSLTLVSGSEPLQYIHGKIVM